MKTITMLRRLIVAAVVLGVAGLLTVAATAARKDTVTLKFTTTTAVQPAWKVIIDNFHRVYPDIKVEATYIPSNTIPAVLSTQLQAGNAPDLMYGAFGPSTFPVLALAQQGKIVDLSSSPWVKRIPRQFRFLVTRKQRIYAPVLQISPILMAYDVDLFQKLGLQPPATFAQLLSLCQKVKAAGTTPIAFAAGGITSELILSFAVAANWVSGPDPKWNLKRLKGDATFQGSSQWRTALTKIVDMKNAGCFSPAAAGQTQAEQSYAQFANGQAGMTLLQASSFGLLRGIKPNGNWGVFVFPGDTAAKRWTPFTASNTVAVNKASQHVKEARMFVDFVMRPKQNSLYVKILGSIAPFDLLNGVVPDQLKSIGKELVPEKLRAESYVQGGNWPSPSIAIGMAGDMTGLFTGQKSVDDILAALDARWPKK